MLQMRDMPVYNITGIIQIPIKMVLIPFSCFCNTIFINPLIFATCTENFCTRNTKNAGHMSTNITYIETDFVPGHIQMPLKTRFYKKQNAYDM